MEQTGKEKAEYKGKHQAAVEGEPGSQHTPLWGRPTALYLLGALTQTWWVPRFCQVTGSTTAVREK